MGQTGPVAVPDVPAYLYFQQRFFDAIELAENPFFPAYGILMLPFGPVSGNTLHTLALGTNALFAAFAVVMAALLVRRLGGSHQLSILGALLAALHPAISNASRIAWPETILACLVLVMATMLCSVDRRQLFVSGAVAGLSLMFHPRMIVIVIAAAFLGVVYKTFRPVLAGVLPGVLASVTGVVLAGAWPSARIEAGLSAPETHSVVATIAGQFLSLVASSAGLAGLGIFVGVAAVLRSLKNPLVSPAAALLGISSIGMLLLGGWVTAGGDRSDTLLYGRYIDPWVVPLAIVGIVFLVETAPRLRNLMVLVFFTGAAAMMTISVAGEFSDPGRRIMTSSLGILWSASGGSLRPTILYALTVTLVGLFCMGIRSRHRFVIPAVLVFAIAATSTISNHRYLADVGRIAEGQAGTISVLPSDVVCLAHDSQTTKHYALWLYRMQAPTIEHRRVNLLAGEQPCGEYVIAAEEAMSACHAAEQIAIERRAEWGLWRYPMDTCG
jgi:hypothetical protein